MEAFCTRHTTDGLIVNGTLLAAEEMLVTILRPFAGDKTEIDLTLEYPEKNNEFCLLFEYPGRESNPLIDRELDDLSLLLVTRTAKSDDYAFNEGMNQVAVTL